MNAAFSRQLRYRVAGKLAGLTAELRADVDDGLLEHHWFDEIPPRVEYSLTDHGRELTEGLQPLREWAAEA